jgi:predicted HicB family RNase H-like nuclease
MEENKDNQSISRKQMNIRLSEELKKQLQLLAIRNGMTLNCYIERLLTKQVLQQKQYE